MTGGATSRVTSRARCQGTRTRVVGEVVDDVPRDVPKQPDARRWKIDSALTGARRLASMDLGESTSRLILLTRVLRVRPVVMISPTWCASCRCLDQQTYQGGTRGSRLAVRIVIGRPRTRRYAQGHGTQDLYRFGLPRWRTLHPVWGIKYGALRLVLGCSGARLRTRPSFI
jgi:hypothetical protein